MELVLLYQQVTRANYFFYTHVWQDRTTVDKQDIERMLEEAEKENLLFAASPNPAGKIVGRKDKARELVRALAGGYKRGRAHPIVFVYGRTGSGKSVMVRLVCESLGLPHRLVNLRNARTVFGCASLILSELGAGEAKAWRGTSVLVEMIAGAIERQPDGRPFVLVLDEFDVLMSDRVGRPSDFVYRLLMVQERLREKGRLMTIVAISNNVMAADELDERVRSRIGSSPEILFDSYRREEILAILKERAAEIFDRQRQPDPGALEHCAELCSENHGDVRRAIDLMSLAGEIAGVQGENVVSKHIDMAVEQLEKDRVVGVMSSASYQLKAICAALVRLTYADEEESWHSTSTLYQEYCKDLLDKRARPLTYRRVSELLTELENNGLVISRKTSLGRYGYGRQYRLAVHPEVAGRCCYPW